jgi:hypothetical protein
MPGCVAEVVGERCVDIETFLSSCSGVDLELEVERCVAVGAGVVVEDGQPGRPIAGLVENHVRSNSDQGVGHPQLERSLDLPQLLELRGVVFDIAIHQLAPAGLVAQ